MGNTPRRKKPRTDAETPRKPAKSRKPAAAVAEIPSPTEADAQSGGVDTLVAPEQQAQFDATTQAPTAKSTSKRKATTSTKPRKPRAPKRAAPVAESAPAAVETADTDEAAEAAADRAFADALAAAFIVYPSEAEELAPPAATAVHLGDDSRDDSDDDSDAPSVVLPFIDDEPRPEPEPWVDLVLEPTPRTAKSTDEWVDQVLEPTKIPLPARTSRPRPSRSTSKTPAKSVERTSAKPVPKAAAKAAPVPKTATRAPDIAPVSGTRWWLVAPVFPVLAAVLFLNRPGQQHAPVPAGALGTWTTAFWLYEHQTLEIKADTVVATLDEPEEGRYPITKVETTDAGRETSVKISYRTPAGDEKVLDFLADKDPTTALRFRAHSGLVWVRPQD
jgi:hypothetical protein